MDNISWAMQLRVAKEELKVFWHSIGFHPGNWWERPYLYHLQYDYTEVFFWR